LTHRRCAGSHYANFSSAAMPIEWTCPNCTLSELPFFHSNKLVDMFSIYENASVLDSTLDPHRDAIAMRPKQVSFMHLNTQSMTSTFDELLITVQDYGFDIITLRETWLKDNKHLLDHVSIPGYVNEFRNRYSIRGGGVGAYIKDSIKYRRRKDIESCYPEFEHLWLEIKSRNKHSQLLLGTMYRSSRILSNQEWLQQMEDLLTDLTTSWNGLLILTGDFNIDLFQPDVALTKQYLDLLQMFNLSQHVKEATRTTPISRTLIDHIITNDPKRVTHTGVLPCSNISDHDGPYACLNIRAERFSPRFKILRSEHNFDIERYIRDFEQLPFSIYLLFQ